MSHWTWVNEVIVSPTAAVFVQLFQSVNRPTLWKPFWFRAGILLVGLLAGLNIPNVVYADDFSASCYRAQQRSQPTPIRFQREVRSNKAMDEAISRLLQVLGSELPSETMFFVAENGWVFFDSHYKANQHCVRSRTPPTGFIGIAHTHDALHNNRQSTLARELPGPEDIKPLLSGKIVYFITPTNALRKIEVHAIDGEFKPVLITLNPGQTFTEPKQLRRIENWQPFWDSKRNYRTIRSIL